MDRAIEWLKEWWVAIALVLVVVACIGAAAAVREENNQRLLAACLAEGKRTAFECELAIQQIREQQRLSDAILQSGGSRR